MTETETAYLSRTFGSSSFHSFFVVRHSERIDESHRKEWEQMIERTYPTAQSTIRKLSAPAVTATSRVSDGMKLPHIPQRKGSGSSSITTPRAITKPPTSTVATPRPRDKQFFANDPPLSTVNGPIYANQAAHTIAQMISDIQATNPSITSIKIYSSRLRRAVQTAHPIAQRLGVPIHLSYGLSTIINAVKKAKGKFEFQSSAELAVEFPDTTFISCDIAEDVAHFLPLTSWIESLHCIIERTVATEIVIIVGHRETIRGIAGEHMSTPYCAISLFDRTRCEERTEIRATDVGPGSGKGKGILPQRKLSIKKQREGPLYPLQQLYDPQGRSIIKES